MYCLYNILVLALITSVSAYALPTDSTGSGMFFGAVTTTPRVQTVQMGTTTTTNYNPTNSQTGTTNGKCAANQVMVGYASTDGTFNNTYRFTRGVDYNLSHSRRTNFSPNFMTSGGTRTISCQNIELDYH